MAEDVTFEIDDAIVLLIGAPANSPALRDKLSGITRLEKLIFLLDKETPIGASLTEAAEFEAHNFGPFSRKVYQAIETLSAADLVTDSASIAPTEEDSWETEEIFGDLPDNRFTTRDIELTERGRKYYRILLGILPSGTEKIVIEFKNQFAGLPLRQLIRYVYTRYPDYTEKSIIRDQVLGKR